MNKDTQFPFKIQDAYYTDSEHDVLIKASMNLVTTLYKWKEMKVDRKGNEYNAEEHKDDLVRTLSILVYFRVITREQSDKIIQDLLLDNRDKS